MVTTHRGEMKMRFKIGSVSNQTCRDYSFEEKDGARRSITEYFESQYGKQIQHVDLPVILKSNGKSAFPMEYLKIAASQKFMKKLSGNQVADQIKATALKPDQYREKVKKAVKQLMDYNNDEYVKSFGLEVSTEMMQVEARQLPAPRLIFGDRKEASGRDGVWNLRGLSVYSAPPLSSMAFLYFVQVDRRQADDIKFDLLKHWRNSGMNIKVDPKEVPVFMYFF